MFRGDGITDQDERIKIGIELLDYFLENKIVLLAYQQFHTVFIEKVKSYKHVFKTEEVYNYYLDEAININF